MSIIPKIKIGRKSDRNFFDKSHTVNTTSDIGFCQPTLLENVVSDSKISLQTNSFVRLAPLPQPTFGRIQCKQHTAFVPYRDVFLAYDAFISRKSVASTYRTYIPESADGLTNDELFRAVLDSSVLASQNSSTSTFKRNVFFRAAILLRTEVSTDGVGVGNARDSYYNPFDSSHIWDSAPSLDTIRNIVSVYRKAFYSDSDGVSSSPFLFFLNSLFGNPNPTYDVNFHDLSGDYLTDASQIKPGWPLFTNVSNIRKFYASYSDVPSIDTPLGNFQESFINSLSSYDEKFFSEEISLNNADFLFRLPTFSAALNDGNGNTYSYNISNSFLCLKLTAVGRRLFKIFNAARINFGNYGVPIDYLSILAYYKSWFEKYNPGRDLQWLETNCYKLIHSYYDFGNKISDILHGSADFPDDLAQKDLVLCFYSFLADLAECTYSLPIDNITVATDDVLNDSVYNDLEHAPNLIINGRGSSGYSTEVPSPDILSTNPYGTRTPEVLGAGAGLGIALLQRIYKFVNKNSVIGQRIDDYLRAHNLGEPLPDSFVLGDNDFDLFVTDVLSTAETSEGFLGEYAGQAKQSNNSDTYNFVVSNAGILVQFMCIVPLGGYVQSGRVGMRSRFDFYNSLYDSLGKEALSQYEVVSRYYLLNDLEPNTPFGFVPQYFRHKVINNLANGGFAFRSQQGQFLGYSLDRLFSVPDVYVLPQTVRSQDGSYSTTERVLSTENLNLFANEYLRFIGRSEGFGNYNRIFYDTTGLTDNFIVDIFYNFKQYSPMRPISESFDTFDEQNDNGYTNISHA